MPRLLFASTCKVGQVAYPQVLCVALAAYPLQLIPSPSFSATLPMLLHIPSIVRFSTLGIYDTVIHSYSDCGTV